MQEQERRQIYAGFYMQHPIEKYHILYESFYGRGMLGNPYGIFCAFEQRKDFAKYEHFWVIKNWKENEKIRKLYESYENVHFVRYMSREYLYHMATAGYLINNLAFPSFYTPRKGQIYFNTWHGTGIEQCGFDARDGNVEARNIIRNFLAADYLLASGSRMKQMYQKSFKLDGIYSGIFLEEGQPRTDILWDCRKEELQKKLQMYGIRMQTQKKLILYIYAETNQEGEPVNGRNIKRRLEELENAVDSNKYQVLIRQRDLTGTEIEGLDQLKHCLIPGAVDLDEVLACTDLLMDEMTGSYYDFMSQKRPVLFLSESVSEGREDLPGPVFRTMKEAGRWIKEERWAKKERGTGFWHREEHRMEDGKCGARILETLIDQKEVRRKSVWEKIRERFARRKEKILFYGSDLRENGVTYSLLSLLDSIDYKKYDVTLLAVLSRQGTNRDKICSVDPRVRVITRFGAANAVPAEQERYRKAMEQGIPEEEKERKALKEYLFREFQRMFGKAEFDHVIEFTGYSPQYGMLLAAAQNAKKYIWQHSDLQSESHKMIKNGPDMQKKLQAVFSLYPFYDKVTACSRSLRNLNREALANGDTWEKFIYVRNSFSAKRVQEDAAQPYDEIEEYRHFQKPDQNDMIYANMGRLSPEKNQKNLIDAFYRLHEEFKDTKLYLLGDGPLKEELENQIRRYHLEQDVIMTGNLDNPFALLRRCDCFVLPSLYEGQPMSVLEVRVLGLPIILSDFSTREDVCMPDGQRIVKKDPDSIYHGMKEVYQNREAVYQFDPKRYNKDVYREFEKMIQGK